MFGQYEGWLLETRQRIFDLMEKASKAHDDREKVSTLGSRSAS
jgi:hypothetical protein